MVSFNDETKHKLLAIDLFSAIIAAVCVAPGGSIVDQAVTEKAARGPGVNLFHSAYTNFKSMFLRPKVFFMRPSLLLVGGVYGCTYLAANSISTMCEYHEKDPFLYTLIGASLVNIVAGVAKDTYYAKMFSGKPISKFPLASWGLFVFRDVVTIGAGFTIPGFVSKMLHDSEVIKTKSVADKVAQLTTPMIAQIVLTPIHLMALDLYNSKGTVVRTWGERGGRIFPFFVETTLIRMARMFCAYGIGGIANGGVRKELRGRVLRNATATA